jgi:hypothetical protein
VLSKDPCKLQVLSKSDARLKLIPFYAAMTRNKSNKCYAKVAEVKYFPALSMWTKHRDILL